MKCLLSASLLCGLAFTAPLGGQGMPLRTQFGPMKILGEPGVFYQEGTLAWDRGEYPRAIDRFSALLASASGAQWLDSIALLTGELYQSRELTSDGTRPVFSSDGRFVAWESRQAQGGPALTTTVVRAADGAVIGTFPGGGAALSPSGGFVALMPATSGGAAATVTVTALPAGSAVAINGLSGWTPSSVIFGTTDNEFFIVAGKTGEAGRNEILRVQRDGNAFTLRGPVVSGDGFKGIVIPIPGGRYLLHTVAQGNPARLATGLAGLRRANGFGIVDLTAGTSRRIAGGAPAFSADGNTLVYTVRSGTEWQLVVEPVAGGTPSIVKRSSNGISMPSISPDGKTIVFGTTLVYDAELYLINSDGTGERRLTREIQNDSFPAFLNGNRVLAVIGEGRHRRSYLYDITTLQRSRLFHNNTVRTIAPEYDWVPSPDGSKVLIIAERDGNTVTLDRGIYLMDLSKKVTTAEVQSRLASMKSGETSLRAKGLESFRTIASSVKLLTEQVDVARIFRYEKSLFDFDSKHISQPGNAKAIDFLMQTYASFGYTPERQEFSPQGALGGKSANVLAVLKGTVNPELVYVVSSHFDSRAEGPGADDNTSGTAALLEAARVMAGHPMPATIIFASFTGEEAGLLGSRYFVSQAVASKMNLIGALNNDMIGWANDQRLDNTIRYSNPGIRDIQHAAAMQFSKLITYDALYYKSTDANAYYDAYGDIVGGIGSYPVLGNPHYHMPHDVLEVENHQLIAEVSKTTVATLMLLASSPSRLKGLKVESRTGRQVSLSWTPSPEKGVTQYIIAVLGADGSERRLLTTTTAKATLPDVAPGAIVGVKAVNTRGVQGWDWARVGVE